MNRDIDRDIDDFHGDIDIDVDHDYHDHYDHYPVGAGFAFGAAAVGTALAVGTVAATIPPSCSSTTVGGVTYQQCGSTWYRPQYSGTQVTYVVVDAP